MKRFFSALIAVAATCINMAAQEVNIEFYTPEIVRVTKTPQCKAAVERESAVVTAVPEKVAVAKSTDGNVSSYKSRGLTVTVDNSDGKVSFHKPDGELLLAEGTSVSPRSRRASTRDATR